MVRGGSPGIPPLDAECAPGQHQREQAVLPRPVRLLSETPWPSGCSGDPSCEQRHAVLQNTADSSVPAEMPPGVSQEAGRRMKIGMLTTWQTKCGIAAYT